MVLLKKEKEDVELKTSENERGMISVELHNEIMPYLATLKMLLSREQYSNDRVLQDSQLLLHDCIERIRSMSKKMSPMGRFDDDLIEAFKEYIRKSKFEELLTIEIRVIEAPSLGQEQNSQLYRILQEIVLNALRHSGATTLIVEFSVKGEMFLIRVADNGCGFDYDTLKKQGKFGLGLNAIRSRVDYLRGSFSKEHPVSVGTKYNIQIPINYVPF